MTVNDIVLQNNKGLDSLVCQTEIRTQEDKQREGYQISFTEGEFQTLFPNIDPSCIFYSPVLSVPALYFNQKTFAAAQFPAWAAMSQSGSDWSAHWTSCFCEIVEHAEKNAAMGNYSRSAAEFPDRMRLEYMNQLLNSGRHIDQLYQMVIHLMNCPDYGFDSIPQQTMQKVLASKTEADWRLTEDALKDLPDPVPIYRGGNSLSASPEKSWYWTTNIRTALFFACRMGHGPAYMAKGYAKKADILEYTPNLESQILIPAEKVQSVQIDTLMGLDFLKSMLPKVENKYYAYVSCMDDIVYNMTDLSPHGPMHCKRVLLLCLLMSAMLELTGEDTHVLAMTAIYHDCRRNNDGTDLDHGAASARAYIEDTIEPDPLVVKICTYHCRPDKDFMALVGEIPGVKEQQERAIRLFQIFKDADGLDLTRFGPGHLYYNTLRTDVGRKLPLVAQLIYQNLE